MQSSPINSQDNKLSINSLTTIHTNRIDIKSNEIKQRHTAKYYTVNIHLFIHIHLMGLGTAVYLVITRPLTP